MEKKAVVKASTLRWKILRQALLSHPSLPNPDEQTQMGIKHISRRANHGFNLIPSHRLDEPQTENCIGSRDARVCYTLPVHRAPQLLLSQRVDNYVHLSDFDIFNRYNIDNTGLICNWPSENVLAYYCLSPKDLFRSKKVIELGAGYGLAGFVIAAVIEASEVVISDGNPQVVNYIQNNIEINSGALEDTMVKSMMLHWNQEEIFKFENTFGFILQVIALSLRISTKTLLILSNSCYPMLGPLRLYSFKS